MWRISILMVLVCLGAPGAHGQDATILPSEVVPRQENMVGPIIGMFCENEEQIRFAMELEPMKSHPLIDQRVLRDHFGSGSCEFRAYTVVELVHAGVPLRRFRGGRTIVAKVKVPPWWMTRYTYIVSEYSWEEH